MINRRIAMSAVSIFSALAITGATAFAAFTSQATNNGNTFSSGNADLQIALDVEGDEVFGSSIPGFTPESLFPGYDEVFRFWLKNNSAADIGLNLTSDVSAFTKEPNVPANVLPDTLLLSWRCDTDGNGGLADNTYTPEFSVNAWFTGGNAPLGDLTQDEMMICEMRAQVPGTATSEQIASTEVTFDVVYDGTQTP